MKIVGISLSMLVFGIAGSLPCLAVEAPKVTCQLTYSLVDGPRSKLVQSPETPIPDVTTTGKIATLIVEGFTAQLQLMPGNGGGYTLTGNLQSPLGYASQFFTSADAHSSENFMASLNPQSHGAEAALVNCKVK